MTTALDLATRLDAQLTRVNQLLLGRVLVPTQEYRAETADEDPGQGRFRLNAAALANVTAGYFDLLDVAGASLAALIESWDDSTSTVRGQLTLSGVDDPAKWAVFQVTGSVTAPSGYRRIALTHLQSSPVAWVAGDRFALQFLRSGDRGEVGAVGPGYAATSATALAVGTGSRSLTTQAGLAYAVGSRVRLARTAAPTTWMEGIVTAYTVGTGAMTVAVDRVSGTGSHSDWTISIAGQGALDAAAADAAAAAAIAARDAAAGHAADADADRIAAQAARSGAEAAASAAALSAADADADRIAAQAARVGAEAARDQAQQIVGGPYQAQDATLTAFAGLTFSATDAFFRATGPDAFVVETAAQMRASLGATTVGSALFTLANPGAIRFLRINADSTVTALDAAGFCTAIGATTVGSNLFQLPNPGAVRFLRINADNSVSVRTDAEMRSDLGVGSATIRTANYTATANGPIDAIDTSAGAITVTLPANPAPGDVVRFADARRTWGTNNVTVARNGRPIVGQALDLTLDVTGRFVTLIYRDNTYGWSVGA